MIFDEHDGLGVVGESEDVFWQLHAVVAGVERAGAASSGGVDWQQIPPPCNGLTEAEVVRCNLIVVIL